MSFIIPPDVLLVLMRPESTFDERRKAATELAVAAYKRGRDDAIDEMAEVLNAAGIAAPKPFPPLRLLS